MLQRTSFGFIPPMLPTLAQEPPAGDNWLHELKHDGFRTQLVLTGSNRRAFTRNGLDWSERYGFVLEDAARLGCSSAVIDGEMIVQDDQGRSDFDSLPEAIRDSPERLIFYAFDLLSLDGEDRRRETVLDRRSRLRELVGQHDPSFRIQFSEHLVGAGPAFFQQACSMELEGIVSKKVTSRYCSGRSKAWLKTKAFIQDEFVVVGVDRNEGGPALALLARDQPDGLLYTGSAFITLETQQRDLFWRAMERLATTKPALAIASTKATWVRPELRVRAKHLRCSGKLRHASLTDTIST
jgi:DNA ligase D-like protein (predicted ligase)